MEDDKLSETSIQIEVKDSGESASDVDLKDESPTGMESPEDLDEKFVSKKERSKVDWIKRILKWVNRVVSTIMFFVNPILAFILLIMAIVAAEELRKNRNTWDNELRLESSPVADVYVTTNITCKDGYRVVGGGGDQEYTFIRSPCYQYWNDCDENDSHLGFEFGYLPGGVRLCQSTLYLSPDDTDCDFDCGGVCYSDYAAKAGAPSKFRFNPRKHYACPMTEFKIFRKGNPPTIATIPTNEPADQYVESEYVEDDEGNDGNDHGGNDDGGNDDWWKKKTKRDMNDDGEWLPKYYSVIQEYNSTHDYYKTNVRTGNQRPFAEFRVSIGYPDDPRDFYRSKILHLIDRIPTSVILAINREGNVGSGMRDFFVYTDRVVPSKCSMFELQMSGQDGDDEWDNDAKDWYERLAIQWNLYITIASFVFISALSPLVDIITCKIPELWFPHKFRSNIQKKFDLFKKLKGNKKGKERLLTIFQLDRERREKLKALKESGEKNPKLEPVPGDEKFVRDYELLTQRAKHSVRDWLKSLVIWVKNIVVWFAKLAMFGVSLGVTITAARIPNNFYSKELNCIVGDKEAIAIGNKLNRLLNESAKGTSAVTLIFTLFLTVVGLIGIIKDLIMFFVDLKNKSLLKKTIAKQIAKIEKKQAKMLKNIDDPLEEKEESKPVQETDPEKEGEDADEASDNPAESSDNPAESSDNREQLPPVVTSPEESDNPEQITQEQPLIPDPPEENNADPSSPVETSATEDQDEDNSS